MKHPLTSVSCERTHNGFTTDLQRTYNGLETDLKRTYKEPVEFYKILASKQVLRLHATTCVPTYSDVINIGLPLTIDKLKGWRTVFDLMSAKICKSFYLCK